MRLQSGSNFEEDSKFEILANTVSIVEQLKGKKITYSLEDSDKTSMRKSSGRYVISLGISHDSVWPKTKLERELAKIVFDSPYERFTERVKKMSTNATTEQRHSFIKFIFKVFDILETRRVESCYGSIYRGANERFIDARPVDAKRKFGDITIPKDPIDALNFARYDLIKTVQKSEFRVALDYIKAVELAGKKGAFDLAIMYWEKVVQPFLENRLQKNENEKNPKSSGQNGPNNDDSDSETQEQIRILEDELSKVSEPKTRSMLKNALYDLRSKSVNDKYNGELLMEFSMPMKIWSGQKSDFEQKCAELKESGKEEITQVIEQLEKISNNQTHRNYAWNSIKKSIKESRPTNTKSVKFNRNISVRLKNIFKKIQGGTQPTIDSLGEEIDVESYIDYKINKTGEFHKSSKTFVGFDIVIAIDESGSMKEEISIAKRMCATLYESISGLPNVRLTVVGWTGDEHSCTVKKITKPSEIGSLDASGLTPIGTAIWYCKHLIESQTSPKRLFILITDGEPNTDNDLLIGADGVKLMRKSGILCNGICVGNHGETYFKKLKRIFGDETTWCTSFDEVDDFLRKKITKQITASLMRTI